MLTVILSITRSLGRLVTGQPPESLQTVLRSILLF